MTIRNRATVGAATLAVLLAGAPAVFAAEDMAANNNFVWGGEIDTKLQGEVTKAAGSPTSGTLFDDSDLPLYANYSNWLSFNSDIKLERQRNDNLDDYYPSASTAFRSEGITLRQLYATVQPVEDVSIYGGKIHPNFGSAFENEPGNFYNFASDYEQDERIGFGVGYELPESLGLPNAKLSFELFHLDTSILSESLLARPSLFDATADRPYRYTRGLFGPSNDGKFDSFTVALKGGRPENGLVYQVSFTSEGTDAPGGKRETGESIGALYDPGGDGIPITGRLGLTPFAEFTHFDNFQGNAGLDRDYFITGLQFTYVKWQFVAAGGLRHTDDGNNAPSQAFTNAVAVQENKAWDNQENLSLNYSINDDITVGAGANYVNVAGVGSWTFGPSVSYHKAF